MGTSILFYYIIFLTLQRCSCIQHVEVVKNSSYNYCMTNKPLSTIQTWICCFTLNDPLSASCCPYTVRLPYKHVKRSTGRKHLTVFWLVNRNKSECAMDILYSRKILDTAPLMQTKLSVCEYIWVAIHLSEALLLSENICCCSGNIGDTFRMHFWKV